MSRITFANLARTVQCPGSVVLCEQVPRAPKTEDALEGDAAHWVAQQYVEGRNCVEGTKAPNGVRITREMIDGAIMWRDEVGMHGLVEVPAVATRIHPTECGGRPDFRRVDPIDCIVRCKDYKYGHSHIDAYECWQLIAGACAAIEEQGLNGVDEQYWTIDMAIVQPRSYHRDGPVRRWVVTAAELRQYVNTAFNAAHEALEPSPRLRVGPECRLCDASHICPALQAEALRAADYAQLRAEPLNLPPAALGRELAVVEDAIATLQMRATGLTAQAEALIARGERVAGFGMEPSRSNLRWSGSLDEVLALGDAMGVDLRKPADYITPTQARDRRLLPIEVIDSVTERPPGKMKLVRVNQAAVAKDLTGKP